MGQIDIEYKKLLTYVLNHGTEREDRTGTGTIAIFGYLSEVDISEYFPIITLKKTGYKNAFTEMLWILKGDTTLRYLLQNNNNIWNEWGFKKWVESTSYKGPDMTDFGHRCLQDEDFNQLYQEQLKYYKESVLVDDGFNQTFGDLGPIYGKQWRNWDYQIDQISNLVSEIKENPSSRRILLITYNPADVSQCALPPCELNCQFDVSHGYLSCKFNMRSNDLFLGFPFDIANHALLTYLIAAECDLKPGKLIYDVGNAHIYKNHLKQVKELLTRDDTISSPKLVIKQKKPIDQYEISDFEIQGYHPLSAIKGAISV